MSSPYRVLNWTILPFLRWRITQITGLENLPLSGGCIIAANHQSWIDSPMLVAALYEHINKSVRFVAQSSKYRLFGGIPINEYDPSSVLEVAQGYLQAGHPIVIFPEGNSNPNPQLRVGKTGAARLALATGAPVLPIGIQGTQGVSPLGSLLWLSRWWRPCSIHLGPPIVLPQENPVPTPPEKLQTVTDTIMLAISKVSGKPYDNTVPAENRSASLLRRMLQGFVLPALRYRVKIRGAEHLPATGPYIVAANHSSYFDPGSIMIAVWHTRKIQPFFLTKGTIAETWKSLLGEQAWHALGMLPIDDTDRGKVIRAAESHIRRQGVIGIFPEGTRNKPHINPDWQTTMLRAKTGVARMALATGAPIVPAAIFSPAGLGIRQTIMNLLKFWRAVKVVFGQPIQFPIELEPSKERLAAVTKDIMLAIAQLRGMRYPD